MKWFGLCAFALTACVPGRFQDEVLINGEPIVVLQTEPYAWAKLEVHNGPSTITFKCKALWNGGGPSNSSAPDALTTEVCVAGRCSDTIATSSDLSFWSSEFYELENEQYAYCHVYTPYWFEQDSPNGPITVEHPEKLVLVLKVPIKVKLNQTDGPSYCNDVVCDTTGCHCSGWY